MATSRFFLVAVLALGSVVLWEDLKLRKISNRWIVYGLLAALGGYLYLLAGSILGYRQAVWLGIGRYYLPFAFYPRVAAHIALSFLGALIVWYLRAWPAGDAKLFMTFSALLPLVDQNLAGFPSYLFVVMLVNAFVPAGLFVLLRFLAERIRAFQPRATDTPVWDLAKDLTDPVRVRFLEEWERRDTYLRTGVGLFVLLLLFSVSRSRLNPAFPSTLAQVGLFLGMFVFWDALARLFRRHATSLLSWSLVLAWLALGALYHWDLSAQAAGAVRMLLGFGMLLTAGRAVVGGYLERAHAGEVAVSDLQPGMILAKESWERLREQASDRDLLPHPYSDGLSAGDVQAITERLGLPPDLRLRVCQAQSFAFWIFFATLWTLTCRGNFVQVLLRAIG